MKRLINWMLAAILLCGASVFTACSSDEDDLTPQGDGHAKKALLIILDGWGIGDKSKGDVIYQTATPYMSAQRVGSAVHSVLMFHFGISSLYPEKSVGTDIHTKIGQHLT